jgi:hypothetical protein
MSDELRNRFDAFANASLAQTMPPGAGAVQRTVRRRYATRAVVLTVAAIVAVAVAWFPLGTAHPHPIPIGPPATISPEPHIAGSAAAAASASPSPSPKPTTTPTDPGCDPLSMNYAGLQLASSTPDEYEVTPAMLVECPTLQLRITRATYVGAGANSKTLGRTAATSTTLNSGNRSVSLPMTLPAPSCASVLIMTYIGDFAAPASIDNYVPGLVATGTEDSVFAFLQANGAFLRAASWQPPAC